MTNKKYIKEWDYYFNSLPKKLEDVHLSDIWNEIKKLLQPKQKKQSGFSKLTKEDKEWLNANLGDLEKYD